LCVYVSGVKSDYFSGTDQFVVRKEIDDVVVIYVFVIFLDFRVRALMGSMRVFRGRGGVRSLGSFQAVKLVSIDFQKSVWGVLNVLQDRSFNAIYSAILCTDGKRNFIIASSGFCVFKCYGK
jgi:hypothetical protein